MVLTQDQTNLKAYTTMTRFLFAMYAVALALGMTAQTPEIVVSPTLCDVIYRGVPNPILVGANAFELDSLIFSVSDGHNLHCSEPGRCELTPSLDQSINTATVMVRHKSQGEKAEFVFEKTFRIEDIPDPTLCFAGKTVLNNTITRELLLSESQVRIVMPGFNWNVQFEILAFDMRIQSRNKTKLFSAQGDRLTNKMRNTLRHLDSNDLVSFESCLVSLPDDSVRAFPPLELRVTP